jgi:hypothetical protein
MLLRHRGHEPVIDPSAFVAPTATLVGLMSACGRAPPQGLTQIRHLSEDHEVTY